MASKNVFDEYAYKYLIYQMGDWTNSEIISVDLTLDIIKDHGQPDITMIKMCDLDSMRHTYGVYSDEAYKQLKKHDIEFGKILECIKRYGDYDNTNFVIIGDHGQTNIEEVLNVNTLLAENGFIRLDENNNVIDCDCFAHSTCLTCYIELKDPNNKQIYDKVYNFLNSLKDDPRINLAYVLNKQEMIEKYHVDGPFDFTFESNRDIAFYDQIGGELWTKAVPGSHKCGAATHGSRPDRKETTTFIASGPSVKKGVVIDKRSMVDEAVTMAKMVGFDMENTDGKLMEELLCK
jgi:predicted AlkP superfamily pyrophosphatase or phosphodiesterase